MGLGDRIKNLRLESNLTLEQVGRAVGVGKSTVRKWETGQIANMRRDKIAKLAKALHTTPGYLMGWTNDSSLPEPAQIPPGFQPMPELEEVPLVGQIACGQPITAEENLDGYVAVPVAWRATFTLICKGDSMEPKIKDGDVVAIRSTPEVENGQIAAVRIGDDATLKRVFLFEDHIELRAENPAFPTLIRMGEAMNEVHIEGRAVGLCRGL